MSLTKDEAQEVIKKFGKNDKDTGSTEVQVALLTRRIEDLQNTLKITRKTIIQEQVYYIVSDRKKLLGYLKKKDPSSYQKLVKDLKIRD